jgi:hypothetical protein
MARKYNEDETRKVIQEYFNKKKEITMLYAENFINWGGYMKDSEKPYSEVIIEELFKASFIEKLKEREPIPRSNNYFIEKENRRGTSEGTNQIENQFGEMLVKEGIKTLFMGKMLHRQMSLKGKQSDRIGSIDLISYNEETNMIYLIELKDDVNKETLMSSVLQIATYYQVLDKGKLFKEFSEEFKISENISLENLRKAVLLLRDFKSQKQTTSQKEINTLVPDKRPNLCKLIKELNVRLFIMNKSTFEVQEKTI